MTSSDLIPITVLTGFLGSGKTTLLNALLRHEAMATALVVVNEFGEIALDHDLIESTNENTVVLQSGCICCTVRNDLIATLEEAFAKRARGEITAFDRVVIETTGLADPAPILQTLMTDAAISVHFRLDGVIATVDAVVGKATLDRHMEAVKQAAVADRIILTKADLADAAACAAVEGRMRSLNPAAPILRAAKGAVDPARLFNAGLYNVETKSIDVQRWLDAEKYARPHDHHAGHHESHDRESHASLQPAQDASRHDDHIHALCIYIDQPVEGEALDLWLQSLLRIKGPDLLRFKAIIHVAGLSGPIVAQGVQHVIYPPIMLPKWPSEDRRTRMVFITHGIDERTIRRSLEGFLKESIVTTQ